MGIAEDAYAGLFGEGSMPYTFELSYSGRFKGYNGTVIKRYNHLTFSISKKWKGVDRQIQIGMLQHLMLKILHVKGKTDNIDLYGYFIKSLHLTTQKQSEDTVLSESCERVLAQMELYDVEKPSLAWGDATFRKLASYNYETDTIQVSSLFEGAPQELLDYLMYHELLHKKFKFSEKNGRTLHHSAEFLRWEKKFPDAQRLEGELSKWVRSKKRMSWLPI